MQPNALQSIMAPAYGDSRREAVFAHAATLAKRFNAHVKVVYCRTTTQDMIPYGDMVPNLLRSQVEEAAQKAFDVEAIRAKDEFEKDAAKHGLECGASDRGGVKMLFVEYRGKPADAIRHHGRLADLICMARSPKGEGLGLSALKSALFASGRPVMVCPDSNQVAPDLGRHVTIGWNGSLGIARAVVLAAPIIQSAERVTILAAGKEEHVATSGEFSEYLRAKGIRAEIARFEEGTNVGHQLLEISKRSGASLMIIGAYHDGYDRVALLGGVTAAVVEDPSMPVILAH